MSIFIYSGVYLHLTLLANVIIFSGCVLEIQLIVYIMQYQDDVSHEKKRINQYFSKNVTILCHSKNDKIDKKNYILLTVGFNFSTQTQLF